MLAGTIFFINQSTTILEDVLGLFNGATGYFLKATSSCVVAYNYARIRQLVRLGSGLYRFPATAHQWSGLVARGI
jgi:hypothetical protein